jgi:hypothetical protein
MGTDTGAVDPSPREPQVPAGRWQWLVAGLAVLAGVLIAAAILPPLPTTPPGEISYPVPGTVTTNALPAPTTTPGTITPTPGRTPAKEVPPAPDESPAIGGTKAAEETQLTTPSGTAPAQSCVPAGPPGFTVTVSPVQATAARGETVTYRMTIEAQDCFAEPIHMELVASVLFLSQTYDLGIQDPPYPKTIEYPFRVPDNIPAGVTVNGIVRSAGGGITRVNQLALDVK